MATNSTNTTSCIQSHTTLERNAIIAVECLITVCSFVGNILVVAVVCRKKKLRTNVNYFITSMAVSDLLVPTLFLPLRVTSFINVDPYFWINGPFGEFTCRFVPYAVEVSIAVSILTMITIAAERLFCILRPFQASRVSNKTCFLIITLIWIVAFALQGYHLDIRRLDSKGKCVPKWGPDRLKVAVTVVLVVQMAIPFVLLVVFSSIIVFNLYHDKMNLFLESAEVKIRKKRNKKVTLMLVVITTVFLAANLPFAIYRIRLLYGDKMKDCAMSAAVVPALFSYTVVNPVVYFAFLKGYRKGLKELLCCLCQHRKKPKRNSTLLVTIPHQEKQSELVQDSGV